MSLMPVASATITTIWVGSGSQCDTSSLTSAISGASLDAGDTTYIYVADDQTYGGQPLSLIDRNIVLTGGFAHCNDPSPVEHTQIVAPHGQRAMLISSNAGTRRVTLGNLILQGGVSSGNGGGASIAGQLDVTFSNVWVRDDSATLGGGIYISGSDSEPATLRLVDGTRIGYSADHYNTASEGGGVYCANALVSVEGAMIVYNTASGNGGGLYLDNCGVYSGGTFSDANGISNNRATNNGGGIYAVDGSVIQFGLSGGHTDIALNSADGSGGGLDVYGAGTHATLVATRVISNSAGLHGGGVFVGHAGQVDLDRGDFDLVCTVSRCAALISNVAAQGMAVYAYSGAMVNLARSEIVGPLNVVSGAAVIYASGTNTHIGLAGVLMDRLPGAAGLLLNDSAMADVSNLTVSGTSFDYDFQLASADTRLGIVDSIVWDAPAVAISGSGTVFSLDNDSHDPATLPGANVDPGFVDAANFDYHLRGDSANVDAYAVNPDTPDTDIDGNPRPYDLFADHGGPYDRGAYELGDAIFADGFEAN